MLDCPTVLLVFRGGYLIFCGSTTKNLKEGNRGCRKITPQKPDTKRRGTSFPFLNWEMFEGSENRCTENPPNKNGLKWYQLYLGEITPGNGVKVHPSEPY